MLLDTSGLLSLLDAREPFHQKAAGEYDNNTFIVQNFLSTAADVTVSVSGSVAQIHDLLTLKDIARRAGRRSRIPRGRPIRRPQRCRTAQYVCHHRAATFVSRLCR